MLISSVTSTNRIFVLYNTGYRLQWLSLNLSEMFSTTVSSNVTTATARGLKPETTYFLILNAYTSVGHGTMYSTVSAATLGW